MNIEPDSVFSNWLSLNSRSCCTSKAISLPYVAVAIRQPPPSSDCWFVFSSVDFDSEDCCDSISNELSDLLSADAYKELIGA